MARPDSVMVGEAHASGRWTRRAVLVSGLLVLLAANLYLRHVLEDAPRYLYSFLDAYYPQAIPIIFGEMPVWRWFLPLQEITGAWAATTLLLTYGVERVVGSAGAWYLFNALSIVVAFTTSWALFRSAVFSFTFALCVGFGTHYYHAYAVTGGIASYLLISYNMLLLFTFTQLVRGVPPVWAWRAAFAGSVALNVFGYEGWLDVLVLIWIASPLVYLGLRRMARSMEAGRLIRMTALMTAIGVVYVAMKVTLGFGQVPGSESDVVFNYESLWPIVDDVISNAFTHTYLAVSSFLPPMLVGASSFYLLGPEPLVAAQHGYQEPFGYLVVMHQVFFWRYYAGAVFALLLGALWLTGVRIWQRPSGWTIALGVFLLMILAAGPTHSLVKFRPMKATPVMTYHVTVGILGVSLLISWLVATAWRSRISRPRAFLLVAAVWAFVLYGALARPVYLSHLSAQAGLGESLYPNPMQALTEQLGGTYDLPEGLAAYRLAPYRPDDGLALLRSQLSELPMRLPPVSEWQAVGIDIESQPAVGGGLDVRGDDTAYGYQLMSPPVPIAADRQYLLRVRYEVFEGRVCAGVLSGDQQRWIAAPDGTTAEFTFSSGTLDSMRIVLANCYPPGDERSPSRFRLTGGSYGWISGE